MASIIEKDLELINKIANGEKNSWHSFVTSFSPYILAQLNIWCLSYCKPFTVYEKCELQEIRKGKYEKGQNSCDEGIELYLFTFNALKTKILKFQGKSTLKTFITACLRFIYQDYYIAKHGKINIPKALEDTSDIDKKVYKSLCRSSSFEDALDKLEKIDISKNEAIQSFKVIEEKLKNEGSEKVWQHLHSQFLKNKSVLSLNQEDNNFEIEDIKTLDSSYSDVLSLFKNSFDLLDIKEKRILKLKFKDNISTKDIFEKYKSLFKFEKENDVYTFIEKSIKSLVEKLKSFYDLKDNKIDTKEFKDSLYDIFNLIEV